MTRNYFIAAIVPTTKMSNKSLEIPNLVFLNKGGPQYTFASVCPVLSETKI